MNLLINASAAKVGGAKFIIEKFISDNSFDDFDKVFIIAPPDVLISNVKVNHVNVKTSGIYTYLFSVFFVAYYVLKFRASVLFSFNNVNLIIPLCRRVTYVHQYLIFSQKTIFPIAITILRFTLKFLDASDKYIVQSELVKKSLQHIVGGSVGIDVCWPGYIPVSESSCGNNFDFYRFGVLRKDWDYICVVPITNARAEHKNFPLVKSLACDNDNVLFVVTSPKLNECKLQNVIFLGVLQRDDLYDLYNSVDLAFIPSREETVGLPMYEFYSTGKPILVIERPYVMESKLYNLHPKNLIVLSEGKEAEGFLNALVRYDDYKIKMSYPSFVCGEWSM